MAKVTANELVAALNGKIGGLVVRHMPDGSIVVSRAPSYGRRRKYSKGQKDHQSRFKEATMYARYAAKAHPIYGELAKGTMKSAYNFALSDWFNPPVIHQVRQREGRILVEASDNVLVTKVVITGLDDEGKVLEKGEGKRREGDWWEYVPNTAGKIVTAEAYDLAGNKTLKTLALKIDYD